MTEAHKKKVKILSVRGHRRCWVDDDGKVQTDGVGVYIGNTQGGQ